MESSFIENFNNFKSLKQLELSGFKIRTKFILKIPSLKILILKYFNNIIFSDETCLNLKVLIINNCSINDEISSLKLPELEECKLNKAYSSIIDFSSLTKIKNIMIGLNDFINFFLIDYPFLEKISIDSSYSTLILNNEKKMFEKFFSIKTLKYIDFPLSDIKNETIPNILGENDSIEKININWINEKNECILYNLQDKFLNLNNIEINIPFDSEIKSNINITENSSCKINQFSLNGGLNKIIQFYIQSYSNLIKADFDINGEILNLKDVFPIFGDNSKVIFESLIYFRFKNDSKKEISCEYLKNIYNNINNMPYLKEFILNINIGQINEDFYKKFIKKILLLKLDNIDIIINKKEEFDIYNDYYSLDEINEISPNINSLNFNNINIKKFKNYFNN